MIIISSAVVLANFADALSLDHPIIGWRNVVTPTTIVADAASANYPASNLANPATHLEWRGASAVLQYLTITTNEVDPIDYVAVARHNWGSEAIAVSIEGLISAVWTQIVEPVMLPDDGPALFRFAAQSLSQVRIKLAAGADIPRAAVVYCGKLLVVERKIYVGHTPLTDGIKSSEANNRSESGNFLGRIELGEWRESTIPLSLLSPDWFRTYMRPFLRDGKNLPFFFGWRPQSYPFESGFAWLTDNPMPTPDGTSHLIAFDLHVSGVV